jgi:hypothetical protein
MESLRYKEFCCPLEIARFQLPLSEIAGRFAELLFSIAGRADGFVSTLRMTNTRTGSIEKICRLQ